MAWKFPRFRIKNLNVIDADDVNEGFQVYAEEVGGLLNEHNWGRDFISRTDCAADAVYRVHDMSYILEPTCIAGSFAAASVLGFLIPNTPGWNVVHSVNLEIDSPGAILWIMASSQYTCNDNASGALFAIRVDGNVIPEGTLGGVELDSDRNIRAAAAESSPAVVARWCHPIVVEAVVPVAPGAHVIDLVAAIPNPDSTAGGSAEHGITQHELIVIEMVGR